MIGVKLTILCVVLSLIMYIAIRVMAMGEDNKTKLALAMGYTPEKYLVLVFIFGVMCFADIVGIIYSAIYLLFFL